MRNVLIVVKFEILTNLGRRSFWISTVLLPVVVIFFNVGMQVVARNTFRQAGDVLTTGESAGQPQVVGYVDEAGLIRELPPSLSADVLRSFSNEAAAQSALEAGELSSYYLISADFLKTGALILVDQELRVTGDLHVGLLEYVLNYNLTGDQNLASFLAEPVVQVKSQSLAPGPPVASPNPLAYLLPFAIMFVFFFLITMSSGFMLQSVSREKENRTMEVLLVSLAARELMLGKVLGLSVIALLQIFAWLAGGQLILGWGSRLLEAGVAITLPTGLIVWGLIYFLLGYLLYASIMGAIGALAPNAREAGSFTFLVILPLMIPLGLNYQFIHAPHSSLSVFLSLFPLTSPLAMVTRLATGAVQGWQPALGLMILALTTYAVILFAARFFRADTLLSGAVLEWRRLVVEFSNNE